MPILRVMSRQNLRMLIKDTSQVYLSQILGVLVSFGVGILVARSLGADGRGAYGLITAYLFTGIQLGQFGLDTLNRRMAAQNISMASVLAGNSIIQSVVLGSLAALCLFIFGWFQPIGQMYPQALATGMAVIPSAILLGVWNSLATVMWHASVLARSEIMQRCLFVLCVGAVYLFIGMKVWLLMFAFFLASGGTTLYIGWQLHKLLEGKWGYNLALFWHERKLLFSAFIAGLSTYFLLKIDMILLGFWRPLGEIGHYAVAQTLVDAMLILPTSIAFLLLPRLAAEKDVKKRKKFFLCVLGGVGLGFAAVSAIAAIVGIWAIPFLYGVSFVESVPMFQYLLIAGVLVAIFQVCQNAVAGYGRARYILLAPAIGLCAKVIGGVLLIPEQGVIGAITASIIAYILAITVGLMFALKK